MKEIIVVVHLLVPESARQVDATDITALQGHVAAAADQIRAGVKSVYSLGDLPPVHMALETDRTPIATLWDPAELAG